MKLIVGLGNPGGKYASTRHNIGFMVVDKLAHELTIGTVTWKEDEKHKALLYKKGDILFVKPLTFMNNSGIAVQSIMNFYKLSVSDLWVVHDDIDLTMGKIRIREKGGTGGHHGIESIVTSLKTDVFVRFRLGIGRGKETIAGTKDKNLHHQAVIDFVLSRFRRSEAGQMKHLVKHATDAVRMALLDGLDKAQNRYH